jgi:hypothetical protein
VEEELEKVKRKEVRLLTMAFPTFLTPVGTLAFRSISRWAGEQAHLPRNGSLCSYILVLPMCIAF